MLFKHRNKINNPEGTHFLKNRKVGWRGGGWVQQKFFKHTCGQNPNPILFFVNDSSQMPDFPFRPQQHIKDGSKLHCFMVTQLSNSFQNLDCLWDARIPGAGNHHARRTWKGGWLVVFGCTDLRNDRWRTTLPRQNNDRHIFQNNGTKNSISASFRSTRQVSMLHVCKLQSLLTNHLSHSQRSKTRFVASGYRKCCFSKMRQLATDHSLFTRT